VVGTAAESDGGSAADDHVILINYWGVNYEYKYI
jgi:hypothetical protein